MGIVDFFKKLISNEQSKEKQREQISFNDLEKWIEKKRKEISMQEQEVLGIIQNQISLALESLKENLKILQKTNIDSKKAEDKIKLIVKENLNNYVHYTEDFIRELEKLKEQELEKFIKSINKIFADFDKKSYLSYQKVTFIVGKEMASIKNEILKLSKYLEKTFEENKPLIESFKTISFAETKLKHLDENSKIADEINKKIKFLKDKQEHLKNSYEDITKELEEIKKTKEYLENLKKKEETEIQEEELEKEIHYLKNTIDFKSLTNAFHANERKMKIIKEHKENFKNVFQETNGNEILRLLKEANLHNEQTSERFNQINQYQEKINKNLNAIEKDKTTDLFCEMNKINSELESLKTEHENELKKHEKIQINKQEIILPIKQELEKIDVFIIG